MINIHNRTIVGLTEEVEILSKNGPLKIIARIDTGATNSAIDTKLRSELGLKNIQITKLIRSTHGNSVRPVVEGKVKIQGREMTANFTVADRSHMRYKLLIGQNVLKEGFLIDPTRKYEKPNTVDKQITKYFKK